MIEDAVVFLIGMVTGVLLTGAVAYQYITQKMNSLTGAVPTGNAEELEENLEGAMDQLMNQVNDLDETQNNNIEESDDGNN